MTHPDGTAVLDARVATVSCSDVDLGAGPGRVMPPLVEGFDRARILVRLHGEPLGYLELPAGDGAITTADLDEAISTAFGPEIRRHLADEGLDLPDGVGPLASPPAGPTCSFTVRPTLDVTVVVCTRNRSDQLGPCLTSLARVTYPRVRFLVVDNAPVDDSTRRVVETWTATDPRFSYVVEPRPGLSRARNRGLSEATGTVVAYTDDDVEVDSRWVEALVRGFQRADDVVCVTGPASTASVRTDAEAYFDARVPWSQLRPAELFRLADRDRGPLFPYQPGLFGTGANFAVRTDTMRGLGGFDEALGAGTATAGGEDLDAFVRLVLSGGALAYEPAALVWHHHRSDMDALRAQMYSYGSGLSAFLAKHLVVRGLRGQVLRRVVPGAARMVRLHRIASDAGDSALPRPAGLLSAEIRGFLKGPLLYGKARRGPQ